MKRWRHFLFTILLLPLLACYAFICVWLAEYLTGFHWLADTLFYCVAGLGWLWPAGRAVSWLARHESN